MKMKKIIALSISIILLFACKKETDNNHPIITIQSPIINTNFNIFDTILVKAQITDESPITSVKVLLTDDEFTPSLSPFYYSPNTTTYDLELEYPINDYYLQGGVYYLQIQATDGKYYKNNYLQVNITEIPKTLNGIIVVSKTSSNTLEVISIDNENQQQSLFQFQGDFASSAINSRNNQLYIAGKQAININAYNLLDYSMDWQLPNLINPPMHSDDCLYFDEYLFSTFRNHYIRGYNILGLIYFTTDVMESALNQLIFRHHDLILVDQQSKNNGITYISTYYLISGVEKQRRQSDFEVVEFLSYSPTELFIICNTENEGQILLYDPYSNTLTHLQSIQGKFHSAIQTEEGVLILSSAEQLFHYNYYGNVLNSIENIELADELLFEPINEYILLVGEMKITTYSYPEFELINESILGDSIQNAHLYYNK